jgi:hypothetical protein
MYALPFHFLELLSQTEVTSSGQTSWHGRNRQEASRTTIALTSWRSLAFQPFPFRSINPQQTILSSEFPHSYANRALNGDIIVLSFSIHSSFRFSMSGFPACLLCGYLCRFSLRYIFITAMSFIAFSVQDLYPLRAALDHVMIVTIKIPIYAYWRLIRTVP